MTKIYEDLLRRVEILEKKNADLKRKVESLTAYKLGSPGRCNSCGETIYFITSRLNKRIPVSHDFIIGRPVISRTEEVNGHRTVTGFATDGTFFTILPREFCAADDPMVEVRPYHGLTCPKAKKAEPRQEIPSSESDNDVPF